MEKNPAAVPPTTTHSAVAPEVFSESGRIRCPQDAEADKFMQQRAEEYWRLNPRTEERAKIAERLILGPNKRARAAMDALCTKKDEAKAKRARAKA